MKTKADGTWSCGGWSDHERGQLEAGAGLTFRERLLWLQEADRMVAALEVRRPWIDSDGVLHEPTGASAQPASTQADSEAGRG